MKNNMFLYAYFFAQHFAEYRNIILELKTLNTYNHAFCTTGLANTTIIQRSEMPICSQLFKNIDSAKFIDTRTIEFQCKTIGICVSCPLQ